MKNRKFKIFFEAVDRRSYIVEVRKTKYPLNDKVNARLKAKKFWREDVEPYILEIIEEA